jgi:hypothetical protein
MTREFITVAELAEALGLKPKTVRNRMYDGTWRRGEHWFARPGIGPRFRWAAVLAWIQSPEKLPVQGDVGAAFGPELPPAQRGRRKKPSHLSS